MTDEELIARLNTVYALLEDEGYYTKANTVDYAATRIIKLLEEKDVHLSTLEHMGMAVERMQKTEARAELLEEALRNIAAVPAYRLPQDIASTALKEADHE